MAVQFNGELIDLYFAPGISGFTQAELPDLTEKYSQADWWIANHMLNSIFRGSFAPHFKTATVNVLFRARNAFTSYHRARELTLSYLGQLQPYNPASRTYFDALAAWETTILNVQHALDLMRHSAGEKAFEAGDDSDDERLWSLANKIKHCGSDIASGVHGPEFTVPMWMTNEGLVSRETRVRLSWPEVTEQVDALARAADELQDPAAMLEQYRESAVGRNDPVA